MIAYSICGPTFSQAQRLGFSVWARNPPKDYLDVYPRAVQAVKDRMKSDCVTLCALVDDIWPRVDLSRSHDEQSAISSKYVTHLPRIGFNEIHLVSEFAEETALESCMTLATKVTLSEFWKLLPQSKKKNPDKMTLAETIGFLWHVHVLRIAIERYQLIGMMAGIRSEFFYLTARKLLPPHDVYFINTS